MRNTFIILAIILTCMLFTTSFSLVSGMMQAAQEQTMHEVGRRAHAGLKSATREQYEAVVKDPRIKKSYYNIFISYAENIIKRQTELRYVPYEDDLSEYFIQLEEGHFPEIEKEIIVDTFVMDELGVKYKSGETIHLTFSFMGEVIENDFIVSGAGSTRMTGALDFILTMQRIWRKRYVRSYQMPGMCRKGNWIMLPVLLIVAVIVPVAAWHRLQKKSIVERLRENE